MPRELTERFPFLVGTPAGDDDRSVKGNRHRLHPVAEMIPVTDGDRGSVREGHP